MTANTFPSIKTVRTGSYSVRLQTGQIDIRTSCERIRLGEALDFANRENPRRPYLFVSKILGRYVPVRPRRFRALLQELAALLPENLPSPCLFVGLAETATGLGNGVMDEYFDCREEKPEAVFMHTTRHPFPDLPALTFCETHSHARHHFLHFPTPAFQFAFFNARTLVVVDDEITTGNTLLALTKKYLSVNPGVERVVFLSIVSWLTPVAVRAVEDELGLSVEVLALIEGQFEYRRDARILPELPSRLSEASKVLTGRQDLGRMGIGAGFPLHWLPEVPVDEEFLSQKWLVLGTGEFNYAPFLLAETLEKAGADVLFQATGRSPMSVGNGIRNKIAFPDHHGEGVQNYLYNMPAGRRPLPLYETAALCERHAFPDTLNPLKLSLREANTFQLY